MLYQGYHTHKPGSFSWPFAFEIPSNPDVTTIQAAKHQWQEKDHFIATDDYVPGHALPPTFHMWKFGFGFRWHAFTEYVLAADVKEAQGASMVLPASSRKAVLPILVRDVASTTSNTMALPLAMNFTLPDQLNEKTKLDDKTRGLSNMQTFTSRHTVRSSRLDAWDRKRRSSGSALSFSNSVRDRTKSIFNSSSLPRYTFDFAISLPEQVQLLQEGAIPIHVDAIPVQGEEHTTIQSGNYPDIRVESISLSVIAHTYIRFKSLLPANTKTKHEIKLLDRCQINHTIDVSKSSQLLADDEEDIRPTRANSTDLSALPGVSLSLSSAKLGRHTEKPLAQTFNTYIIAREYSFTYRLELDVAGEKVRVSNDNKVPVRVLPPESEQLADFLRDTDLTKKSQDADEEAQDDGESESEADEIEDGTDRKKGILGKIRSRHSKAEEAAAEAAACHSRSPEGPALQFQHAEALPTYQAQPTNFEFRNEIEERPPRYEAD